MGQDMCILGFFFPLRAVGLGNGKSAFSGSCRYSHKPPGYLFCRFEKIGDTLVRSLPVYYVWMIGFFLSITMCNQPGKPARAIFLALPSRRL